MSHTSAVAAWGLQDDRGATPELWTPRHLRSDLVIVHRGVVDTRDIRIVQGIRVTSVPRTLVDLAAALDEESIEALVEDAFYRGLTTPMAVQRCLEALGGKGRAGSGRLRKILSVREDAPALESRLELRVWRLLRRAGLRPVRQYSVRYGDMTYRLDFAWPALKVGIEADGYASHAGTRRFVRDRSRVADLAEQGWRIVPVTWQAVTEDPARFLRQVRGALLRAAA